MVNVVVMGVAHGSAIAGIGGGVLLARDRMLEMDGDQWDDAGQLGDQKQPQQPAAEPTSRVPRNHGNPTPPADISTSGPRDGGAKGTARGNYRPHAASPFFYDWNRIQTGIDGRCGLFAGNATRTSGQPSSLFDSAAAARRMPQCSARSAVVRAAGQLHRCASLAERSMGVALIGTGARVNRRSRSSTSTSTPAGKRWSVWSRPRGAGIAPNQRNNPMQSRLPMHRSPRCGARTRSGSSCRSPAMLNGRCRLHGGLSPGAPKGNRNAFRHGRYSAKAIADRREVAALLRAMRALAAATEEVESFD
jgi:hypothetical protein